MSTPTQNHYLPVRDAWLASRQEEILDPAQPIIDPHHHLWDRPGWRYLLDDMLADIRSGHDVRATVLVQARAMHRAEGPEAMRPVGETEFANGVAAMCASGIYGPVRVCAGIVGFADLTLGAAVRPVLEAHVTAGGGTEGRFRGIRHIATWDPDTSLLNPAYMPAEDMLASDAFRAGFAELTALGLSFDAWLYFHQIPRLAALARAFPTTPIVLNHCGGVLGIGRYAGRREEVFTEWSKAMRDLAACPNVMVKLGGLGMRLPGFGFEDGATAPSSAMLAEAWRPWMEGIIAIFGTARCMFESNFPVDKGGYGYAVGWNAFKRLAAGASAEEKADLFWRSAARFYRLPDLAKSVMT
ncbi:amidohydrolase family protein [Plastoroseomonas hellenica]|uniref:amidohydrolase family protein n=1 Tax=Plastoroseomonas hellenica TaxID=2687306 RepID=UPI002011CF0A|nr:amidohydrolase family protein [Plastoroseomonas hellenica]MBR0642855.1 amidohydrolase family protein [Plastoroseomonas hellenica]